MIKKIGYFYLFIYFYLKINTAQEFQIAINQLPPEITGAVHFLPWAKRIIDKLFGGVGLRRGRKNNSLIFAGDSLDFWRVIYANPEEKRLLLYAEMKLPGEAWLEFKIENHTLIQTATFRPLGLWGRLYWYSVLPFHGFIFNGMLKELSS